ncbi:MAG TPA: universal stress protein [Caldilineaceae bacterium]|nr:universal stress protein [Caldilineaceae bacterium]
MSEQEQRNRDALERNGGPTIRRIVVALDATAQSAILLEAAALLAQHLGVELTGIFVEDSNLLRLGELSFVQETGSYAPARRPLQAAQLERQLRSQAAALQRAIRNTAERYQIPWTFQVLRGPIADELRKAAAETDLFIVGRSRQSRQGRVPLGTTTRAVVITAPRFTLVLHQQPVWQQPVVVVYDGSAAAERALTLATQLTQAEDVPLMVVLVGEEAAMAQELRQTVATWLHQRGLRAHYQWLSRANIARLVNVVVAAQSGALVLPGKDLAAQETALLALLDELQCPVLLVQ